MADVVDETGTEAEEEKQASEATSQAEDGDDIERFLTQEWDKAEQAEAAPEEGAAKPVEAPEAPSTEESAEQQEAEAAQGAEAPRQEQQEAETDPLAAPESWTQVQREQYDSLPDAAKQMVLDKFKSFQADYTRKTQEIAPVRAALDRHKDFLTGYGVDVGAALDHDLTVRHRLTTGDAHDRVETVLYLAREAGVLDNLRQVFTANGNGQQQAASEAETGDDPDPYVQSQVQQALAPVTQEVQQLRARLARQDQGARESLADRLMANVEHMRTAKDDKGNLMFPYFGDLENDIAQMVRPLVERGQIPDLQPIYEQALWSNPTTRNHLLAQRDKAQRGVDQAAAAEAAKAAKAKTVGIRGTATRATTEPASDADDIEQFLVQNWEKYA